MNYIKHMPYKPGKETEITAAPEDSPDLPP